GRIVQLFDGGKKSIHIKMNNPTHPAHLHLLALTSTSPNFPMPNTCSSRLIRLFFVDLQTEAGRKEKILILLIEKIIGHGGNKISGNPRRWILPAIFRGHIRHKVAINRRGMILCLNILHIAAEEGLKQTLNLLVLAFDHRMEIDLLIIEGFQVLQSPVNIFAE